MWITPAKQWQDRNANEATSEIRCNKITAMR